MSKQNQKANPSKNIDLDFLPPLLSGVFLTIVLMITLLISINLLIVDEAGSQDSKWPSRYTLVLLSAIWLVLKKGQIFPDWSGSTPLQATRQFFQHIVGLMVLLCLAKVLAIIVTNKEVLDFFQASWATNGSSGLSSHLLSAGAIILAVTTGYYLWALIRTEDRGQQLISEMEKRNAEMEAKNSKVVEIEKKLASKLASEEMVRANTVTLSHLMEVQGKALKNITNYLAGNQPETRKALSPYDNEIIYCSKLLNFLSMSRSDDRGALKSGDFVFLQQYLEIRKHHQDKQLYDGRDWDLIQPVLHVTVRHLKSLFPDRNESGTEYIWELIDNICDDLNITPKDL